MTSPYVRPDVRQFLDMLAAQNGPKTHEVDPATARAMFNMLTTIAEVDRGDLAVVRDLSCPGPAGSISLRLYDARASRTAGPVLVFFHGGGFVIGDLNTHDSFCAEAARVLDIPVVAVDYRLAPEHPWPAAPDDCEAATRWVASSPTELGMTVTGLALAGDSAGGTLTIVTAMALRDQPAAAPLLAQLPIYPATNPAGDYPSMTDFAEGYLLTADTMLWFGDKYAADLAHARAAPMLGDHGGMPPSLVVTAGLDPLRDMGRDYVGALAQAGCEVSFQEAQGNIHGFINIRKAIPSASADVDRMLRAFKLILDDAVARQVAP